MTEICGIILEDLANNIIHTIRAHSQEDVVNHISQLEGNKTLHIIKHPYTFRIYVEGCKVILIRNITLSTEVSHSDKQKLFDLSEDYAQNVAKYIYSHYLILRKQNAESGQFI